MFWKKKDSKRSFNVNIQAYPEMMAVPFLFGAWLSDKEWQEMLASVGKYAGPVSAVLFFGNGVMVRLYILDGEDESGKPVKQLGATQHMYRTRDGGVMDKRDMIQDPASPEAGGWGESYELKWYMTQDLGLMFEKPEISFERFKPATLEALYAAGFSEATVKALIADYRALDMGFIETFTEAQANEFIDQRFENEADGLDLPAPAVQ